MIHKEKMYGYQFYTALRNLVSTHTLEIKLCSRFPKIKCHKN